MVNTCPVSFWAIALLIKLMLFKQKPHQKEAAPNLEPSLSILLAVYYSWYIYCDVGMLSIITVWTAGALLTILYPKLDFNLTLREFSLLHGVLVIFTLIFIHKSEYLHPGVVLIANVLLQNIFG